MYAEEVRKIENVIEFTRIYNEFSYDKMIREAKCVEFQLSQILRPLEETDRLAGGMAHGYVGFSSQYGGIYTYFFHEFSYLNALESCRSLLTEEQVKQAEFAAEFWKLENTAKKHCNAFISRFGYEPPHGYKNYGFANCDSRVAGTNLDFHKLMELGLDGLEKEVIEAEKQSLESEAEYNAAEHDVAEHDAAQCDGWKSVYRDTSMDPDNDTHSFYQALQLWIQSLRMICEMYRRQALSLADSCVSPANERFRQLAEVLERIQHKAPATFLEGIQLMWIYSVAGDVMNYGRMDDYLGALYAEDLKAGRMTEEEAVELLLGLYKHFKEIGKIHDCRVIIGGLGRRFPKQADELAMAIMEASRIFKDTVPQLTLRYYKGMSERVFHKAMEVIGEGCTFPIIYSDETNIPAVEKMYGVTRQEAERYVPFGCGEYVLEGLSVGTPNNGVNLLKALEITLHNGKDAYHNVMCGRKTGNPSSFTSFEQLWEAFRNQLQEPVEHLAVHKKLNYDVAGSEAPFLHLSLLMDDCIKQGKPLLSGGVRYLNAASEIFGMISCADSLSAIKKYVYDEKRFTLPELVEQLDHNYEGNEAFRQLLLKAPKYGNDDFEADRMAGKVYELIADMTMEAGKKAGLNCYGMVSVNNSMSAEWGSYCMASACGRRKSDPMSNANAPSLGADQNGITALLNSMAKFDPSKHVGVINNIRFTREMFTEHMEKVKLLLQTFYENGGVQNNITVVGKQDLENAMKAPEQYQNLLVRIGGFSARFVTLSPVVQREIIARTTYEA